MRNQIKEQYQKCCRFPTDWHLKTFLAQYYSMSEDDFNKQVKDAAKETVKAETGSTGKSLIKEKLTPSKKETETKSIRSWQSSTDTKDVDALKRDRKRRYT